MSVPGELLSKLQFEQGFVALDNYENIRLSTLQIRSIHEVELFDIDGVFFSGNFPTLYFKSVTAFDKKEIDEICSIHRKIWNQMRVPFLYVESLGELRIYNCFKNPLDYHDDKTDAQSIELYRYRKDDTQKLDELIEIFGRFSLESGEFWKKKKYSDRMDPGERVDQTLIKKLKDARAELHERKGVDIKIVHNLLIRSLFILYLEDRGAATPDFYNGFLPGAAGYLDILDDKDAVYKLFAALEESFNGNLSPVTENEGKTIDETHLKIIKDCFWCSLLRWRPFDFSIIPIELISQVYEEFLKTENGEEQTSKDGSYYTPLSLVEFILNEKLPWADKNNTDYKLRILDPACGSGIFLVEAYRRLIDRWKFSHPLKKIGAEDLKGILLYSIYGVEISLEAIKITAFSLYLAMLNNLEPKSLWYSIKFPFLVVDSQENAVNKQGNNLFCTSSLSDGGFLNREYDLVVGNPPFKRGGLEEETKDYLNKLGFAQEYVLAFLHRAVEFSPHGQIAMVASSKILFNKSETYKKFRNFLFQDAYVEAIYNFSILRKAKKEYGGQLIPSAVGPVCIIFYQAKKPATVSEQILYCAPKSPIKKNMVEGIVIDSSDLKYLPREECEKNDSNIWKVAMWATDRDYSLIEKLSREKSLKEYFDMNRDIWQYGTGLHKPNDKGCYVDEYADFLLIPTERVERFFTCNNNLSQLGKNANYRPHDGKIFYPPIVIFKQGQKDKRFCASYIPYKCVYLNAVYGVTAKVESKLLKALVAYTNSSLATYFLFLTASNWGIEREIVKLNEILSLPGLIFSMPEPMIDKLAAKVDEIISLKKNNPVFSPDTSSIEKEIDAIIYRAMGLSQREQQLIEDTLTYGLGLFQDGEKSEAYHRPNTRELECYAQTLCDDLNGFLQDSEMTASAEIYEMRHDSPLNMVALRFSNSRKPGGIERISSDEEIRERLKEIDKYTYSRFSQSIYFRKIVKYYNDDTVFIIKPNEKRFWSRSMAMNDTDGILIDSSQS